MALKGQELRVQEFQNITIIRLTSSGTAATAICRA